MVDKPFDWEYPVYVLPNGPGLASIVAPEATETPALVLIVHTDHSAAQMQMAEFSLFGTPRAINNDRELGWLLQSLRAPVSEVAFDPNPEGMDLRAAWRTTVLDVLDCLSVDRSPWNYPVFVVHQSEGYLCIDGAGTDGEPILAVNVYPSKEKAADYLKNTNEEGEIREMHDLESVREFIVTLSDEVAAVAYDPVAVDDRRSAKHCFLIPTLLEKYLIVPTE